MATSFATCSGGSFRPKWARAIFPRVAGERRRRRFAAAILERCSTLSRRPFPAVLNFDRVSSVTGGRLARAALYLSLYAGLAIRALVAAPILALVSSERVRPVLAIRTFSLD